ETRRAALRNLRALAHSVLLARLRHARHAIKELRDACYNPLFGDGGGEGASASEQLIMANRGRATFAKRQKEIARQERAREKAAKRVQLKETKVKVDRDGVPEDPDIAGIVPGPQPLPYDLLDEDEPEPKP